MNNTPPFKPFYTLLLVILFIGVGVRAQHNPIFIEPGISVGKVIGNYPDFPETDVRAGFSLSAGKWHVDTSRTWPSWFNFPMTGATLGVHRLGNDAVYGYEIDLIPFAAFSPSRSMKNRLWFRLGMGLSYFSRHYFSEDNTVNKSIGSSFNWAFQIHMYKNWMIGEQTSIRAGIAYLHGSNGHTQLPNFGLNSFAADIGAAFFLHAPEVPEMAHKRRLTSTSKPVLLHARYGIGLQEFGGTIGPVGGAKRPVHCITVGAGFLVKPPWKLKAGFTYRYYPHINNYYRVTEDKDNRWQASNLLFSVGTELMMGHFGIDVEVGINIFKPYYRTFFDEFESGDEFQYALKRMFPSRFGLNAYLISNEKAWKNNLYLGAFICANFGEADFTELSLTYVHRISK